MIGSSEKVAWARNLLCRSDVEAAWDLLHPGNVLMPGEDALRLSAYIRKFWPGMFSEEAYSQVYKEAGEIEARATQAFDNVPNQTRFKLVHNVLAGVDDCKTVLDYGCSRGLWATHLHNLVGKEWHLVDIDSLSLQEARKIVQSRAKNPRSFSYQQVGPGVPSLEHLRMVHSTYDCLLLLEVLEHVPDPWALLTELEKLIRPGGLIVVSTPYGPTEYPMWVEHPERNREHLREFSFQDLMYLADESQIVYAQYIGYGLCKYTQLATGHFVVAWRKDKDRIRTRFESFCQTGKLSQPVCTLHPISTLPGEEML